jgi:hypothetical protein
MSRQVSVAEPFLDEVERDAGRDGGHAEAMAQPLGRGLRAIEVGRRHHGVHGAPAGHARPGPEADAAAFATTRLELADAVHQVERVEQGRRDGHSAVDPRLALLQGLEHKHAGGEVDTVGGERECFGQAAAGIGQGHAEGAHQAVGTLGFPASRSLAVTYFRAPSAV